MNSHNMYPKNETSSFSNSLVLYGLMIFMWLIYLFTNYLTSYIYYLPPRSILFSTFSCRESVLPGFRSVSGLFTPMWESPKCACDEVSLRSFCSAIFSGTPMRQLFKLKHLSRGIPTAFKQSCETGIRNVENWNESNKVPTSSPDLKPSHNGLDG